MKVGNWHISLEHHYFKSRRDEYSVRVWRDVKYKRPPKSKDIFTISDPRD